MMVRFLVMGLCLWMGGLAPAVAVAASAPPSCTRTEEGIEFLGQHVPFVCEIRSPAAAEAGQTKPPQQADQASQTGKTGQTLQAEESGQAEPAEQVAQSGHAQMQSAQAAPTLDKEAVRMALRQAEQSLARAIARSERASARTPLGDGAMTGADSSWPFAVDTYRPLPARADFREAFVLTGVHAQFAPRSDGFVQHSIHVTWTGTTDEVRGVELRAFFENGALVDVAFPWGAEHGCTPSPSAE